MMANIFRRMLRPMDTAPASRKQLTHDRILDTAARVLRDSGFQGVGVADIMKRAGLTHGGFYAHFPSRDALLAEALARAGEDSHAGCSAPSPPAKTRPAADSPRWCKATCRTPI
jgi:TetR/AcrR family transcriptional repressor of nem operon